MDSKSNNNRQRGGKRNHQSKRSDLNRHKPETSRQREQQAERRQTPETTKNYENQSQPQQQPPSKEIFINIDQSTTNDTLSTNLATTDKENIQQVSNQSSAHKNQPDTNIDEIIPDKTTTSTVHIDVGSPEDAIVVVEPISTNVAQNIDEQQDDHYDNNTSLDSITNLTKLNTASGSEVYLVGTAHFSQKSVQDVQKVIKTIQPNAVILELCEERAFMLQMDEESLLEQNRKLSFDKVRSAIVEKGLAQGLIYIMLVKMSANLTEKLGMAPGSEFRVGSHEAMKIPGCGIILGDRSLKVTIARAVASLSLWQKLKLIYQVLLSDVSITQEDVEKCKDMDILEQMLQELGGEYPGFKRVLLDERNIYLAHSLYSWSENSATSHGPAKVVGIVGCGHIKGIVENWGTTTDDDCREIIQVPERSRKSIVITKTIKYCSLALLLYVGYRAIVPTSIQNAIYERIAPN